MCQPDYILPTVSSSNIASYQHCYNCGSERVEKRNVDGLCYTILFVKNISTLFQTFMLLQKCYNLLGVKVDSDQETVRAAFLKLVKRFHPDSRSSEADPEKFQEVSFKSVLN